MNNTEESIQAYITSLNTDKEHLIENLNTKGVEASGTETFTSLVPKVLLIQTGTSDKQVYLKPSVQEMNEITDMQPNDLCLVYKNTLAKSTETSQFQIAYFPSKVTLPSAITDNIYMNYNSVDESSYGNGQAQISDTYFRFMFNMMGEPGSEFFVDIEYESTDGINYTRTDTNSPFIDFTVQLKTSPSDWSPWNDVFGYFFNIGEATFTGVYQYLDNMWNYAPTTLTAVASDLYPDITAYSSSGLLTGSLGKNITNGYDFIKLNDIVSNLEMTSVTNLDHAFNYCQSEYIPITVTMDTSNVTSMVNCFVECTNLKSLDLRNWDTSKVEDFSYIFQNCSNLEELLGYETMVTSSAKNISGFFNGCSKLTNVDISEWDTSNVTNFAFMFYGLPMNTINIKSLDFSNAENIEGLFSGNPSLTSIEANTSQIIGAKEKPIVIGQLFTNSTGLQTISLNFLSGYFSTTSSGGMGIFEGCSSVETIDLSPIKLISGCNAMFKNCTSLKSITGLENLVEDYQSSSTPLQSMFEGCTLLENINVSNWQNCTIGGNMMFMCLNCSSLKNANLQSINGDVLNLNSSFRGCSSLEILDLRNANLSTVASYGWNRAFTDVPSNCEIIVKDQASKDAILSHFSNLTNIKLVSELTET